MLLQELDDQARDVDAGGLLDALEAGRGVHLHHDRSVVRAQHVDAAHVEPHRLGGAHGGGAVRPR